MLLFNIKNNKHIYSLYKYIACQQATYNQNKKKYKELEDDKDSVRYLKLY